MNGVGNGWVDLLISGFMALRLLAASSLAYRNPESKSKSQKR